jgi:hypothetical protein
LGDAQLTRQVIDQSIEFGIRKGRLADHVGEQPNGVRCEVRQNIGRNLGEVHADVDVQVAAHTGEGKRNILGAAAACALFEITSCEIRQPHLIGLFIDIAGTNKDAQRYLWDVPERNQTRHQAVLEGDGLLLRQSEVSGRSGRRFRALAGAIRGRGKDCRECEGQDVSFHFGILLHEPAPGSMASTVRFSGRR